MNKRQRKKARKNYDRLCELVSEPTEFQRQLWTTLEDMIINGYGIYPGQSEAVEIGNELISAGMEHKDLEWHKRQIDRLIALQCTNQLQIPPPQERRMRLCEEIAQFEAETGLSVHPKRKMPKS